MIPLDPIEHKFVEEITHIIRKYIRDKHFSHLGTQQLVFQFKKKVNDDAAIDLGKYKKIKKIEREMSYWERNKNKIPKVKTIKDERVERESKITEFKEVGTQTDIERTLEKATQTTLSEEKSFSKSTQANFDNFIEKTTSSTQTTIEYNVDIKEYDDDMQSIITETESLHQISAEHLKPSRIIFKYRELQGKLNASKKQIRICLKSADESLRLKCLQLIENGFIMSYSEVLKLCLHKINRLSVNDYEDDDSLNDISD